MEVTDLEANLEEQSKAVHQEVPKEHATVRAVRGLRKQHRGQNLATECCQKPKEQTRENCGSLKKLTTTTKNQTRDMVSRTSKSWMFRRRHQPKPERKSGIRNQGLRQQLQGKREFTKNYRKTTGLELEKQTAKFTVGLQKIKDWTLWRGQPPPKQKKTLLAMLA
jgi:hypothetical protein